MTAFPAIFFAPTHPNQQSACEICGLAMAGVATSGVILSTFCNAADEDYELTVLSDACADSKPTLHQELMTNLFPRSAKVADVETWSKTLAL